MIPNSSVRILLLASIAWVPLVKSLRAEPFSIPVSKDSILEQMFKGGSSKLHREIVNRNPIGKLSTTSGASDAGHLKALQGILDEVFLSKGESVFTQRIQAGTKTPYEIRGLEMGGPNGVFLTEADKLNGIDQRMSYHFKAKAWRSYHKVNGWSEWKPGLPLFMTGITLERVNRRWLVKASPKGHYSLR